MAYSIRFCGLEEKAQLIRFIQESWESNHILVSHPEILDWQYRAINRYNFVVAHEVGSDRFEGVLGFISPRFFAKNSIESDDDLWLSLWKVEKIPSQPPTLGMDMLTFLRREIPARTVSAIGINSEVARLYRALGCSVRTLSQFFIPNYSCSTFRIAQLSAPGKLTMAGHEADRNQPNAVELIEVTESSVRRLLDKLPPTSRNRPEYILARYGNHPVYVYRFLSVVVSGESKALIVLRKIFVNESSCLRVTEFVGLEDSEFDLSAPVQKLLQSEGSEYLDLLIGGVDDSSITALGFVDSTEENYVPHLFEPFSRERATVSFAVFDRRELLILKGDSDLDRPNWMVALG